MATKKILSIRYTIVGGQLPNGMKLNPDTGEITGAPGSDSIGQGPTWTTAAGSLGAYDEGNTFTTVNLQATSTKTPVVFSLPSSKDVLPWGIQINPMTGTISGTIAPLLLRVKEAGSTSDGPTWNTPFGKIGGYDEGFVASVSLSATPLESRTIKYYEMVDGYLPWGLKLNTITGVISGTVDRLKTPGAFVDVPKLPVPVWVTATNMGNFHETESFSSSLVATPDTGRSMALYSIRSGYLPFGLKLNTKTGLISGTMAFGHLRNDPVYYDSTKDPVISDTVVINGSNTTVANNGSIGSYAKGATVSANFSATPVSGRTINAYVIPAGTLPFGLKLNPVNGQVTGTVINNARVQSKTYNFTITVYDKGGQFFLANSSSRNYTITVQ